MSVRTSAADAADALQRNPVLFVAALAVAVVNLAVVAVESALVPATASLFWWAGSMLALLVSLFFMGGAYGMATEALGGETGVRTLLAEGRANYLSLVGATLALTLVGVVVAVLVGIVVAVAFFAVAFGTGGGGFVAVAVVMLGAYLIGLLPYFFLQFYAPAVVVSDDGAVDSLKRSFGLVRRNLLATLGFDAVLFVMMVVTTAPTIWLYVRWWNRFAPSDAGATASPEAVSFFAGLDPATVAAYLVSTLVLGTLGGAFFYTYQVAFYGDLLGEAGESGTDAVDSA